MIIKMTKQQFTKGINAELKAKGFTAKVARTIDCGVNTTLVFASTEGIHMKLITWLNDRFHYGISLNEKQPTYVYLNTPLDKKVKLN